MKSKKESEEKKVSEKKVKEKKVQKKTSEKKNEKVTDKKITPEKKESTKKASAKPDKKVSKPTAKEKTVKKKKKIIIIKRKIKKTETGKPVKDSSIAKDADTDKEESKNKIEGVNIVSSGQGKSKRKKFYEYKYFDSKEEQEKELALRKKQREEAEEGPKMIMPKEINIPESITISELARKLNLKGSDLIKKMMELGAIVNINQSIDSETATIVASEFKVKVKVISLFSETVINDEVEDDPEKLQERAAVVTIMGHVDHGKTMLLDSIRKTRVIDTEAGGITQKIGAYKVPVEHDDKEYEIVFLDTPGHEAFTNMRARGAKMTDIVIVVVAADDGVKAQTVEAINHAKEAGVPIIVALNKMDLQTANPDKVKNQMMENEIVPESLGGKNIFIELSAKEGTGINQLLESIILEAEVLELKANPDKKAKGTVVEARKDIGLGSVATILVQDGTLSVGDFFVAGLYSGKVRALINDRGERVQSASPSTPVEVLGIEGVPYAGDPFHAVESEKYAKQISSKRQELNRMDEALKTSKVTLENLYEKIEEGLIKELKIVIKGDNKGSVEALKDSFEKLSGKKVRVKTIHSAAGNVSESDVILAAASNALIIAFNTSTNAKAIELSKREKVNIYEYDVIYRAIDDIKKAMEGLLDPLVTEEEVGKAEVREIFKVSSLGNICGCYVTEGKIKRNDFIKVLREDEKIHDGKINSLKHIKDDIKEVVANKECGILVDNFNDVKIGDIIIAYQKKEKAQKLFHD